MNTSENEKFSSLTIEARLGLDVFKVDKEGHIVPDEEECGRCKTRYCLHVCPARLYTLKEDKVVFDHEGCLECGTCRITCLHLSWNLPKGGFGIQYRFG